MPLSIHDNVLLGHTVACDDRRIILRTEFRDASPVERTDVVFEGVETYAFENDDLGTILFSVEEVPLPDLLRTEQVRFEAGRRFGWPRAYGESTEDYLAHLKEHGIRAWRISSSVGLTGWVLAQRMTLERVDEPA